MSSNRLQKAVQKEIEELETELKKTQTKMKKYMKELGV